MTHAIRNTLAAAALLVFAGGVYAQHDDWYASREGRWHGEGWRMRLFSHVREDLDHVQSVTFGGRDQYRLTRTKEELNELQGKLEHHEYDQGKLDEVIASLQRVASDNHMAPRDREMLNDDLSRLRDYREHHENWGH